VLGRDPYPAVRKRGLLGRGKGPTTATLAEVARRELADPRLVALLESHAAAYGFDPRSAPASAAVLPYMEETFGSWYVRGGMRALADALFARCTARKVEFAFGAEVTRIVEKDGRAAGVELADGRVEEADVVVSGVAPALLEPMLRGGLPWGVDDVRPGTAAEVRAPGRFTVALALSGRRPQDAVHRTVVHPADRGAELAAVFGEEVARGVPYADPTVTVLRPDDPECRPDDDHEAVTLTATVAVPLRAGAAPTGPGQSESFADRMTQIAEAAVPGLRGRLLWREILPAGEETRVPGPALAGAEGRFLRPANRTRVAGLYAVGGWSHPGGGLAHAGMSGAIVAGLIVNGDDWRGST
jgi:phytoene dehydrogenase-like protein